MKSAKTVNPQILNSSSNLESSQRVIFKEKYENNLKMVDFEHSQPERADPEVNIYYRSQGKILNRDLKCKVSDCYGQLL